MTGIPIRDDQRPVIPRNVHPTEGASELDVRPDDPTNVGKRHRTRYAGVYYRLSANGERRYQISYKDSDGKRIFKTMEGNERDAVRERNQILERMHKGEKVVHNKLTLRELAEDYLRTQTGHLKPKTLSDYGYFLDHWIFPRLGERRVAELTVHDIADFVAEMQQLHSANTVRNCLKPLSRMFQYAIRRGWSSNNPVQSLDRQERPRGTSRRMRILSSEEIQQLLAVRFGASGFGAPKKTPSVYRLLFMTAIFTGLRKGELLALTWDDIDLLQGVVTVREGKTEAAARQVVMPDFLVQALAGEMRTEGKVFPFEERNCNRALEKSLEVAGIEHLRFHDLRHTFASILIGQGEDVTYVADQMGHASPSTTLKTYAKLFDPVSRRTIARERTNESFKEVVG